MSYHLDDTIAAVATAVGGAARGVVRVAGPGAAACLAGCFRAADGAALSTEGPPRVVGGAIELAGLGRRLPCDVYWWPTARSYTRTPLAEIHTLGSPPLLAAVLRTVCSCGARVAEPGEFTLRAFLSGRIDLAQAEAVLGVIDAAAAEQLETALAQLAGGLSGPLHQLRESLLDLLSQLEAGLDFADEDLELITADELATRLSDAQAIVERAIRQLGSRGEAGPASRAVLMGSPNVGKSSLFNALLAAFGAARNRTSAALVSPEPGTTRDYLTARLVLGDVQCELVDTAGLDPRSDERTAAGAAQSLATEQHGRADLRLLCLDASRPLSSAEQVLLSGGAAAADRLVALTKCDLPRRLAAPPAAIETSAATGRGIERLGAALANALTCAGGGRSRVVAATSERCRESMAAAAASLSAAGRLSATGGGEELIAAEIRAALTEIGKVTGAVYTDDILDRIFTRFCIGK